MKTDTVLEGLYITLSPLRPVHTTWTKRVVHGIFFALNESALLCPDKGRINAVTNDTGTISRNATLGQVCVGQSSNCKYANGVLHIRQDDPERCRCHCVTLTGAQGDMTSLCRHIIIFDTMVCVEFGLLVHCIEKSPGILIF